MEGTGLVSPADITLDCGKCRFPSPHRNIRRNTRKGESYINRAFSSAASSNFVRALSL
jgi:hypothetical protein